MAEERGQTETASPDCAGSCQVWKVSLQPGPLEGLAAVGIRDRIPAAKSRPLR